MIAIHLHPPVDRAPDHVLDSPAIVEWWAREGFAGNSMRFEYDTVLELIRDEPGNEALKLDLLGEEGFTMAAVSRLD